MLGDAIASKKGKKYRQYANTGGESHPQLSKIPYRGKSSPEELQDRKEGKRNTCTWAFIFSSSKHPFCLKFNKKKSAAGDKAMQIKDDLQNSKIPLTF